MEVRKRLAMCLAKGLVFSPVRAVYLGVARYELIYPLPAFGRVVVIKKVTMIGQRRNSPGQVQIQAAEIRGVVGPRLGRDARFPLPDADEVVDLSAQGQDFFLVTGLSKTRHGAQAINAALRNQIVQRRIAMVLVP